MKRLRFVFNKILYLAAFRKSKSTMSTPLIIERNNKKVIEAIKKLHEAKAALRLYIINGGNVENYNPRKSKVHNS